jgi:glycosyltransferase involved in cell wall biosynthesis
MRLFSRRADGVFAISRYLESHFAKCGLPVLRVPPLFNQISRQMPLFRVADGRLHLCYAGTPGRKELFAELFAGLRAAASAGARIQMHMVGMTEDAVRALGVRIEASGEIVRFHGRVTNQEAVSIFGACDFMVLLRSDQRFSRAGFPSKIAESLCCGTPIMANLTSDLADHLRDGENAIIIRGVSPHLVSESIQRAARMSDETLKSIRGCALQTSLAFRPEAHAANIAEFISRNR